MIIAIVFAVSLLLAAFCVWYFSDQQMRKRTILAAPRSTIAQAQPGMVAKLTGRVSYLTEPIRAPLSGRQCAYYLVTVDACRGAGNTWATILCESDGVDFLIEDGTGRARVVNRSLKVVAVQDANYSSGAFNDATPQLEEYLAKHGQQSAGLLFNRKLRYQEAVFEAGETVAIVGQVGLEHDPGAVPEGAGYRENSQRAVIAAPPGGYLLASDDPAVVG